MKVSLVIPVFNEADRLEVSLKQLDQWLPGRLDIMELIFVNDGSSDHSQQILSNWAKQYSFVNIMQLSKNCGKGAAVRVGALGAKAELVLFMDADLSTHLDSAEALLSAIHDSDIVIGCRQHSCSEILESQSNPRRLAARLGNIIIRFVAGLTYPDTQCGFKLFRRKVVPYLFSEQILPGYLFDVELLLRANKLGYRVARAPVVWEHKSGGRFGSSRQFLVALYELGSIVIRMGRADKNDHV